MNEKNDDLIERQREYFNSIAGRYHEGRQASNHLYLKDLIWRDVFSHFPDLKGSKRISTFGKPMQRSTGLRPIVAT